jgi:hypothetical protein
VLSTWNHLQSNQAILRGAFDEFASAYSPAFEWPKTRLSQPHRRSSFSNQMVVELIAQVVIEVIKVLDAKS